VMNTAVCCWPGLYRRLEKVQCVSGLDFMIPRKKLQVFVFSTYADLKEERQAAVEAILSAGHIPAGMELFAAGKRRSSSDGSMSRTCLCSYSADDTEASNQRPERATSSLNTSTRETQGKPFFAVVVDEDYLKRERVKAHGADVLEIDNPQQLKAFRAEVLTKIVRLWRNPLEIKRKRIGNRT
jgi:hypothetical protein